MSINHSQNNTNTAYSVMVGVTGICEIVDRYEQLKADSNAGIPLKQDDEYFLKAFSEFLSMKQGEGETLSAFNQRKKDFLTKNYQHFVQYEKFAKQLEMSLPDYILINEDIAINRPKWSRSAKRLNKTLGGQLSDDLVEVLSRRIISYSPVIKGKEGSQRINLNTEELLYNFVKRANTPPDGKYFACMLEDFVKMPDASSIVFMPDNGWLQKNSADGVHMPRSSSIQLKNNDMDNYSALMHEIHHYVNDNAVRTVQKGGHNHLGNFFNEALSKSDDWLVDSDYNQNAVLKDIRLHYEGEAKKLYPNDISKQARYAFTKARGCYMTIMLAGDKESIQAEINDFYLKTGAKKTATNKDFDDVRGEVLEWYDDYQDWYKYQFQKGGEATRARVNEYLKKHFGADVKMGDNFLQHLDQRFFKKGFLKTLDQKDIMVALKNNKPTVCVDLNEDEAKEFVRRLRKGLLKEKNISVEDVSAGLFKRKRKRVGFVMDEFTEIDNIMNFFKSNMIQDTNGKLKRTKNGSFLESWPVARTRWKYDEYARPILFEGYEVINNDFNTLEGLKNRAIRAGLEEPFFSDPSRLIFPDTCEAADFLREELTIDGRDLKKPIVPKDLKTPLKIVDDYYSNDGAEIEMPDVPKELTVQEAPDIQNKRMSECAKKLPLEMKLKRVKGDIPYETQYTFKSGVLSPAEEAEALEWYREQGILFNKVGSQYVMTSESADIFTTARKLAKGEGLTVDDLNRIYRLSHSNSPEAKALKMKMLAQKYNGNNARVGKLIRQFNAVDKTVLKPVSKALGVASIGLSPTTYNTIADGKYEELAQDFAAGLVDLVYMINDVPKLAEKETWTETLPSMAKMVVNTSAQIPVELGESANRMGGDSRFPGDDTPHFGIRHIQGADKEGNLFYQGEELDFSESQLLQIYGETENKWYTPVGQYTIEENANKTKKLYIDEKGNLQSMDTVYHWWFFPSEKESLDDKQPLNGVLKLTTDKMDRNRWNKVSYDDKHNEGEYLIKEGHVKEKRVFNLDGSVSVSYYDDTALSDELVNLYGEVGVKECLKDIKIGNVTHTVTMKPLEKEYQVQSEDSEFVVLNERVTQENTSSYPLPARQGPTKVQFSERYNTEKTITTAIYKVPKKLLKDVPLDKLQEKYEKYATKKYYVEGSEKSETHISVGERRYVTPKLSEEMDKNNLILLREQGNYLERDINYTDHKTSYFDSRGNCEFIQSFEYEMDKKDKTAVSQTAVGLDIPVSDDKGNIILNFDTDLRLIGCLDSDFNQPYPIDKMEFVTKEDKLYLKLEGDREIDVSKKISFVNGEGRIHEQLKQKAMAKLTQKQIPFVGSIVQTPLKDKKERQTFLQDDTTQIVAERKSRNFNQFAVVNEKNEKTAQILIDKKTGVVGIYSTISKDKTGKFVFPKQQYVDEPKNNSDKEINWQKYPESDRYNRIMSKVYQTEFMSLSKKSEKETVETICTLILNVEQTDTFSLKTLCFLESALENIDYEALKKHLPADVLKKQMEILKKNSDKLSPQTQTELKKWVDAYEKEVSLTNATLSKQGESITIPEVDQTIREIASEQTVPLAVSHKKER